MSAGIALWQARSAKGHAEKQLKLAERQAELAWAEADEAAGPAFEVVEAELVENGEWFVTATVRMVHGPPLAHIDVTVRGEDVRWLAHTAGNWSERNHQDKIRWPHVSRGASLKVIAQMEYELSDPANLTIDMECAEQGGASRHWTRSVTASADMERRNSPSPSPTSREFWGKRDGN